MMSQTGWFVMRPAGSKWKAMGAWMLTRVLVNGLSIV